MALDPKTIPGLPPEAQRALSDVQASIRKECARIEQQSRRPRRRVTELVEEGAVQARPGEVVRVQPGDEDVTVVLPEPSAASDGEDIVISVEGDGTQTGRVQVVPANGTCLAPGIQTLNAPGTYRFTSVGGGQTAKPRSAAPVDTAVPSGSAWGGPPEITVDDLPPIGPDEIDGSVAGDGLTGGGGTPLAVGAGDGIDVTADGIAVDVTDIAGSGIESDGSNNLRIAASAAGDGLTGGAGSPLAVGAGTNVQVTANAVSVDDFPLSGLADQAAGTVVANVTGGAAPPTAHSLTTLAGAGLTYTNVTGIMAVGAGTGITVGANDVAVTTPLTDGDKGDITVSSNGTVWTIDNDVVSDAKLRNSGACSVIGRSANSSGDPADISAGANDRVLSRESNALAFTQVSTAMIADAAVTLAKMENRAAGTVIGRQIDASTGAPVALTGAEQAENFRRATVQTESGISGDFTVALAADTTVLLIETTADARLQAITHSNSSGREIVIEHVRASGSGFLTLQHQSGLGGSGSDFLLPNQVAMVLGNRSAVTMRYRPSFWRLQGKADIAVLDGDKGDITVATSGTVWTIDNDAVTDAKLRNSAALSVIGRSANSTGDPADIAAANDGEVLRRSGTSVGFGTVATAGLADASVTPVKLAPGIHALSGAGPHENLAIAATVTTISCSGSLSIGGIAGGVTGRRVAIIMTTGNTLTVIHGSAGSSAGNLIALPDTADYAQLRGGVLLEYDGTVWRAIATATLPLRDGDKGDITVSSIGTVWTIDNAAVSLAKMADLAQSRIIGRAESAGTGVPTALTPTQVAAIIDGESPTWTGDHTFTGANFITGVSGDVRLAATSGIGLYAGEASANVTTNNIDIRAAGITRLYTNSVERVEIDATGNHDLNGVNYTATMSGDVTISAGDDLTLAATTQVQATSPFHIASTLFARGIISPSIGADQNDWNPTGLSGATVIRVTATGASRNITGISGGASGRILILINIGSNTVVMQAESGSSSAANRIIHHYDSSAMTQDTTWILWYDGTSSRWRVIATADRSFV